MIRLENGDFGTYRIVNVDTGEDILFQIDYEYINLAEHFGYVADYSRNTIELIEDAIDFLDDNIGKEVEDIGYFN
jgi:hypothetical protein